MKVDEAVMILVATDRGIIEEAADKVDGPRPTAARLARIRERWTAANRKPVRSARF